MKKQTIAVLGPGSVEHLAGPKWTQVRAKGNISDQIDEINDQHTTNILQNITRRKN